jgi:protein-disulfide isomerase
MNDWKLILKVTIGCAVLLMISIWGLSKMAGTDNALKVDEKVLLEGARFVKENGETRVTVVNFSDMQCPACKVADLQTRELFNKQGVKIVLRLFPLPATLHRYALISAKAAETARIMGKGFEMMNVLYDKQEEWSAAEKPEDSFVGYAKSLGLDEKIFGEKLGSAEVAKNVQVDANLAASLQLSGTPTYFVNGEQVGSPFVVDKVKQLLGEK